jgi:hypothetical protein
VPPELVVFPFKSYPSLESSSLASYENACGPRAASVDVREDRFPTGSTTYVTAPFPLAPLGSPVIVSLLSRDAASYPYAASRPDSSVDDVRWPRRLYP